MKQTFPLMPFYFIRHGETNWNNERRVMGQKDIPINQKEIEYLLGNSQQMEKAAYAITSLIGQKASAESLLPLSRNH